MSFLFLSDAERKLAFLDVEGFDIFGKNSLFVPLIKWKALKEDVDTIQKAAEVYENTFNDIITSVKNKENFKQVIQLYQVFLQVRTWVYPSLKCDHVIKFRLAIPKITITYHNALCLHPKFCISVVFSFSLGHFISQRKLKTMLMQNFGVTDKKAIMVCYGIF